MSDSKQASLAAILRRGEAQQLPERVAGPLAQHLRVAKWGSWAQGLSSYEQLGRPLRSSVSGRGSVQQSVDKHGMQRGMTASPRYSACFMSAVRVSTLMAI